MLFASALLLDSIEPDLQDSPPVSYLVNMINFWVSSLFRMSNDIVNTMVASIALPVMHASECRKAIVAKEGQRHRPPPSYLAPRCHPLEPEITKQVDGYFIQHWPFPSEKAVKKFRDAGFSRVTCCYYPEALEDRIHLACRLLTLLFLIDGEFTARDT